MPVRSGLLGIGRSGGPRSPGRGNRGGGVPLPHTTTWSPPVWLEAQGSANTDQRCAPFAACSGAATVAAVAGGAAWSCSGIPVNNKASNMDALPASSAS